MIYCIVFTEKVKSCLIIWCFEIIKPCKYWIFLIFFKILSEKDNFVDFKEN